MGTILLFTIVSCECSEEIRVVNETAFGVIDFQVVPKGFAFVFRYCVVANSIVDTIRKSLGYVNHRSTQVKEPGADKDLVGGSSVLGKVGVVNKTILFGVVGIGLNPFTSFMMVNVISIQGLETSVHHWLLVLEARIRPVFVESGNLFDLGHVDELVSACFGRIADEVISYLGALPDSGFACGKGQDALERIRGKPIIPGDDV